MSVQQYSNSSGGGGGGGFEATAEWAITLSDGKHRIQFEHGTTSGKRVIVLDGKVSKNEHILDTRLGRSLPLVSIATSEIVFVIV